jgi:outer membrane protein assembly factor BamB
MQLVSRLAAIAAATTTTVVATAAFAPSAFAAYAPDPVVGPTWHPDRPVNSVLYSGNRVYIGGTFTGGVAALDATTGALLWNANADGDVRALALSSDGSQLLAGGAFTHVNGVTHRKLASLNPSTGVAATTWKASAGGTVRDIVVVGGTAYFGGVFTTQNGVSQHGLGAVSVTTGTVVSSFAATTDSKVYALATDGSRLYFAGDFTTVNGQPRASLASVTLATGTLDAWSPTRACTACNLYWDLALDGTHVFAASRNAGAVTSVDTATGRRAWTQNANGDAQALTVIDGDLYVGGHFTKIPNPTPKVPGGILAKLSEATGAVDQTFRPKFVTTFPGIWALDASANRLFVGGHFTGAGLTQPSRYPYFAMFGGV